MADKNMGKSNRRGITSKKPAAEVEKGVAAEGLKRKHADMDRVNPPVSQELTCAVEQSPTEPDGVRKSIYVFMSINSTLFSSALRTSDFHG